MFAKHFVVILSAVVAINSASGEDNFPDNPKPCKHGDVECVGKIVNYIAEKKFLGDPTLNLIPFDPLDIPKLHISRGDDSPVRIDLMLTNGKTLGLKTAKFVNMTGFEKNLSGKYQIVLKADFLQLLSDYTINGQILILPIRGTGKSNLTIHNPVITLGWVGTPVVKDGNTHMKTDKFYVDVDANGITFKFENLFNDKALSDNMNKFLTENWSEVYTEIRQSLGHGIAPVARKLVKKFFEKFPYDKVFLD